MPHAVVREVAAAPAGRATAADVVRVHAEEEAALQRARDDDRDRQLRRVAQRVGRPPLLARYVAPLRYGRGELVGEKRGGVAARRWRVAWRSAARRVARVVRLDRAAADV
eukprot:gene52164-18310_t